MNDQVEIEDAEFEEVPEPAEGFQEEVDKEMLERIEAEIPTQVISRQMRPKQQPFRIDDQDGKPDEQMIQVIMNMNTLDKEFKMDCLNAIVKQNYGYIEKRIMKKVGESERATAAAAQKMLRAQIKRDKKFAKRNAA